MTQIDSDERANGAMNSRSMANGLGWFSIGLGLIEVVAPQMLARSLGMRRNETMLRAYGLREIATGVGILSAKDPTPWVWGRVGGDALDLATLATGFNDSNERKDNVGLALAAVAGVTLLDALCAMALKSGDQPRPLPDYSDRSGFPHGRPNMRDTDQNDMQENRYGDA